LACRGQAAAVPPAVGSVHTLLQGGEPWRIVAGQALLSELNCLSCHPARPEFKARIGFKPAPDLRDAGARLNASYVREYLLRPHSLKPGSTMPDLLRIGSGFGRDRDVDHLVHFIASLGGPLAPSKQPVTPDMIDAGRRLYHTLGCVACHPAEREADAPPAGLTPLGTLWKKTTVERMAEFLLDPLATRPHGRMPRVPMTAGEALRLAAYLLRDQQPPQQWAAQRKVPGLHFQLYAMGSSSHEQLDAAPTLDEGELEQIKVTFNKAPKDQTYTVRFTGFLRVSAGGKHELELKATGLEAAVDIDGQPALATGKNRKTLDLAPGDHPLRITYRARGQGKRELALHWKKPSAPKLEPVEQAALIRWEGDRINPPASAFVVDPEMLPIGQRMFGNLGCADCHKLNGIASKVFAPDLSRHDVDLETGCLSVNPARSLPVFRLSDEQKQAIRAALKTQHTLPAVPEPAEAAMLAMTKLGCLNCHPRGELGGPAQARSDLFKSAIEVDLGDEGRLPPTLTLVGAKLKPAAFQSLVARGEGAVRPYLAMRMPAFGPDHAAALHASLAAADVAAADDSPAPVTEQTVADGHRLVGVTGLGCVNCHGVAGRKSLGVPAIDLSTAAARLRPGWLRQYLANPAAINRTTRMPPFWINNTVVLKDIAAGTVEGQMNAIAAYLSLGAAMPIPEGLSVSDHQFELVPRQEPILLRAFTTQAGTRSIAVGYPQRLSVLFDPEQLRLAAAWRGRFINATPVWTGRGGGNAQPLGEQMIELPPGPAVALLNSADDPWPDAASPATRFLGYRFDSQRRPIFQYQVGDARIEESPLPVVSAAGVTLQRRFDLAAVPGASGLYLRAAVGNAIQAAGPNAWTIDGSMTLTLSGASGATPIIRRRDDKQELLVPLTGPVAIDLQW
jgi:mono/diheme cytochrome c family protein